ncbi:DegT/DnrJ/EryC1/StrS family aminotransferase [Seonamhaeicola aphaedonensis]|uniref:dTDP-4-amino-4,6-dideoxygalactose transaminase n=1 Tax=Seonamhaeicola aphaedonensis TaxID=1461338 RepID=A0A3D9HGJ2_9FLAO|nr:DegT/DnrJ/EryC1/StrS family aminotransferase [Seonamhaeicola aphaedonensis]RED48381.1 dTDP-4-amino-4,6-dideoxygalactose transaminase [Seonamhaeicola aphaedonensis]
MINVTKTFLPPQEEYQLILKKVWEDGWITNRGALVKALEEQLKAYLSIPNIICMTNGTLPLQIAIKALGLQGEIITTPFSYVATTSSIVWEGCKPVFVDIHPDYLTIDETKIEAAITPKTSAILATHVFGNPCDVETIDAIAKKHHLKVIYDAAHCFGVQYKDQSIFNYGDISTCSFHATKLFHTGEGGAIVFKDDGLYNDFYYHHNFGHKGNEDFFGLGINAKMSELQAAMGLALFPYLNIILESRRSIVDFYNRQLQDTKLKFLKFRDHTNWNYSYYPIIFKNETQLLNVVHALNAADIFPRRYFYPSLDNLPYLKNQHCQISNQIAASILCLPLYHDLTEKQQTRIVELIKAHL